MSHLEITEAVLVHCNIVNNKYQQDSRVLIGNIIANRITKVLKNYQQNNSETVTNEHDKETSKDRYISPEERQESIDELRLKQN